MPRIVVLALLLALAARALRLAEQLSEVAPAVVGSAPLRHTVLDAQSGPHGRIKLRGCYRAVADVGGGCVSGRQKNDFFLAGPDLNHAIRLGLAAHFGQEAVRRQPRRRGANPAVSD